MAPGSDGGVATLPMLWNSQPGLAQYQHAIISCDTSCCDSYLDVRHPPTQDIGRFDEREDKKLPGDFGFHSSEDNVLTRIPPAALIPISLSLDFLGQ